MNADRILLEATRRTDELGTLRGLLPAPDAPLLITPRLEDATPLLTDVETLIATALRTTAATLADQLGLDELTL